MIYANEIENLFIGAFILYMIICLPTIVWGLGQVFARWQHRRTVRDFRAFLAERGWDKDYKGPNYLHRSQSERAEQEAHPKDGRST